MENNKIIKITVAIITVLTLLLVGYFLMANSEEDLDQGIFLDLGNIKAIGGSSIVVELTPIEGGVASVVEIGLSGETKFVRMLVDTWMFEDFTKEDEAYSSFDNLEVGSLVAVYVDEDSSTILLATKVILLDYPQASGK